MKDKYTVDEVFKYTKKIALSSKDQVRNGRGSKAPCINWDKQPNDYKGFNDLNYGTAVICDYIEEINQHLVVIDLDKPKHDDHIPIDVLKECMEYAFNETYTVKTQSGGYHIYLLSQEKPNSKQPKHNIDYLTNTGESKGKYVVTDFIWDNEGNKIPYNKLDGSPDIIFSVKNTDLVLNKLLSDLEDKGYQTIPETEYIGQIANIIKRNLKKGHRNDLVFSLSGYLIKNDFNHEVVTQIVRMAFKGDEELIKRLKAVDEAFKKDPKDLKGWKGLKDHIHKDDLMELETLVNGSTLDLKGRIMRTLTQQKESSPKLLADYLNSELTLYLDSSVMKYYERHEEGTIVEIDYLRISEFMNKSFGVNQIPISKCKRLLQYVTNQIRRNYDIIEFNNGFYNTVTRQFNPNKEELKEIPKLTLSFNWNPDAESGKIGEILDEILTNPNYPNNKELWLRAVGHSFIGANRIQKMVMIQGESGTGKSTLTTILKRVFKGNYSELKTHTITKNERFTLYSLIGKAINIDDDISNGRLQQIGNLNTVISGNGLEVEIKGETKTVQAEAEQLPKLFANGNTLPEVVGTGFERRLLLIHADNQISYKAKDEYLQSDIYSGKYDNKGIEWIIYTAINTYLDKVNEPLTNPEDQERMKKDYELKANPLKYAIETLFEDSWDESDFLEKKEVHKLLKQWSLKAYKDKLISIEHRRPSIQSINEAMDEIGYNATRKTMNNEKISIFEDIRLKDYWKHKFYPETNQQDQRILVEI